jgi:hypothetical protein
LIDFLVFDIISELFFGKSFELKVCNLSPTDQEQSTVRHMEVKLTYGRNLEKTH